MSDYADIPLRAIETIATLRQNLRQTLDHEQGHDHE